MSRRVLGPPAPLPLHMEYHRRLQWAWLLALLSFGSALGMVTSAVTAKPPITTTNTSTTTTAIPSPRALPLTSTPGPPVHHVGAMFEVADEGEYEAYVRALSEAIVHGNNVSQPDFLLRSTLLLTGRRAGAPRQLRDVSFAMVYVCDAVFTNNITSLIAVGSQRMINVVSVITQYMGIPIIGYNTDERALTVTGKRPLYLQMDPSPSLLAGALHKTLEENHWYYASIIIQDDYATDGFLETFISLTAGPKWKIEDQIRVSKGYSEQTMEYRLHALLENASRVIILHCSATLAKTVFRIAERNGFTGEGYAWFVTEDVVLQGEAYTQTYPVGLLAFTLDYGPRPGALLADAVELVARATRRLVARVGAQTLQNHISSRGCNTTPSPEHGNLSRTFYNYLKSTTFHGKTGDVAFDENGVRTRASFKMLNLVYKSDGVRKRWKNLKESMRQSTIIWPGNTVSGPITLGERTLRVVTNVVKPFVMDQVPLEKHVCVTSVPCLKVNTKDKEVLDNIFKDFQNGTHVAGRDYEVRCCQGLSIMLLERLARDLNFTFQLYLTKDYEYGRMDSEGNWTGLVEDLMNGAAHMAVAALSITRARAKVIDYTEPYFYSGFSILVSESKRETPIYAFMEPFDGWVWISIVISATVVAVALSLLEWNSPFGLNPWGRKRKTNYTLGSGLNMVYAILFQHTIKTKSPKAWPSKWLQNYWAGASIFIYSSYTANLAAFLAGKNSGVTITGIHDPKLLEPTRIHSGLITGNAVEDILRRVNLQLLSRAQRFNATMPMETAVTQLMDGKISAYLDDTPILEYARANMDHKCVLRLVGEGFGEDGYGIGLPKGSWLKQQLSQKILEYHESGFIEDLKDMYFRRSKCNDNANDGQLQGQAERMHFGQHAGLYLLLGVGVFVCVLLMFLEHATFKWMVPYWRRKPAKSFWKSLSMMFYSQRLYRIITSEVLVSPHHSAREMIEVMKNRDFTKLFQKSVKKQERQARNRKNLFSVVEQLQWKQRREERLSQHPSLQTDCSQDSDNSATPVNLHAGRHCVLDDPINTDTNDENGDDWPENWEKEWIAGDDDVDCLHDEKAPTLYKDGHVNHSFSSQADILKFENAAVSMVELGCVASADTQSDCGALRNDYGLPDDFIMLENEKERNLLDISLDDLPANLDLDDDVHSERGLSSPGMPLLGKNSTSEDNIITGGHLPNGVLILSPNGDVFAKDMISGKNILVRPKNFVNFKNFTATLPQSMKTLPLGDTRVKPNLLSRSRTLERLDEAALSNNYNFEGLNLESLTKEQLYFLWRTSEKDLCRQLRQTLHEKAELERKLAEMQSRDSDT